MILYVGSLAYLCFPLITRALECESVIPFHPQQTENDESSDLGGHVFNRYCSDTHSDCLDCICAMASCNEAKAIGRFINEGYGNGCFVCLFIV